MGKYLLLITLLLVSLSANAEKSKIYQLDEIKCNEEHTFCTDKDKKPVTGIVETKRNGKRVVSVEYKNGSNQNGKRMLYSSDGIHPLLEFTVKNGHPDGARKVYWNDTHTLRGVTVFSKGKRIGKSTEYYKNGKKQVVSTGRDLDDAKMEFFDKNGELFAILDVSGVACYKNNKKVKNVTDKQKIAKLTNILGEQDKMFAEDPTKHLFVSKEDDFSFLCK